MPSPFPGMDPYIEDPFFWSDFHASMMGVFRTSLNTVLPERYTAAIERNVWVQEVDLHDITLVGAPDVQVADRGGAAPGPGGVATAVAAPVTTIFPLVRREGPRYLRITDRHRRQVVTVIELLSPANKTATGYGVVYRQKRLDYVGGGVNLVEIDLLRAGARLPLEEPAPPPSDYSILVCDATAFPTAGYWPLSVRDPLPVIPVPLTPAEQPVALDLRACLDLVYAAGRYENELDYSQPPSPPLRDPDAAWARELLAGRRHPA